MKAPVLRPTAMPPDIRPQPVRTFPMRAGSSPAHARALNPPSSSRATQDSKDFSEALRQAESVPPQLEPPALVQEKTSHHQQDLAPVEVPIVTDANAAQAAPSDVDHLLHHSLLAQPTAQGQFELLLPQGQSIGVTYDVGLGATHLMLEGRSRTLARQLKSRADAIAQSMSQRSGKPVHVVAL
jgi:hypothetical protein